MARVVGSYPACHPFESDRRYQNKKHPRTWVLFCFWYTAHATEPMPQAFVRRSGRFENQIEPRSSSSADFSGTAEGGRKIKRRRGRIAAGATAKMKLISAQALWVLFCFLIFVSGIGFACKFTVRYTISR